MRKLRIILLLVVLCTLSSAFAIDSLESEYNRTLTPNVMLVLDASGSMASTNVNQPKIDAARGVIHQLMSSWNRDIAVSIFRTLP